jgi:hypothetical protein
MFGRKTMVEASMFGQRTMADASMERDAAITTKLKKRCIEATMTT